MPATLGPPRWGLGASNIALIPGLRDVRYSSHRSTLGWYRAAQLGNAVKDFGSQFHSIRAFFREFCHSQFPTDPASVEA